MQAAGQAEADACRIAAPPAASSRPVLRGEGAACWRRAGLGGLERAGGVMQGGGWGGVCAGQGEEGRRGAARGGAPQGGAPAACVIKETEEAIVRGLKEVPPPPAHTHSHTAAKPCVKRGNRLKARPPPKPPLPSLCFWAWSCTGPARWRCPARCLSSAWGFRLAPCPLSSAPCPLSSACGQLAPCPLRASRPQRPGPRRGPEPRPATVNAVTH